MIATRVAAVRDRIARAAGRAGRQPEEITLVAVSKTFPPERVREAFAAGLRDFGENKVQEAEGKVAALAELRTQGVRWHLVGHLQANKARPALRGFAAIHSVDSLELLARLDRIAAEESRSPAVLLQVNVTGEGSKAGFALEWFEEASRRPGPLSADLAGLAAVRLAGLMTIGPAGVPPEESRQCFAMLRRLRDQIQQLSGQALSELSMGMTADADAAAAEGATLVRVGTAIFGPRPT